MIRIPTYRQPTHPGEIFREEVLNPMGLTQRELTDAIHIPYQRVNDIVNGRRSITPYCPMLREILQLVRGFLDESPDVLGYVFCKIRSCQSRRQLSRSIPLNEWKQDLAI